MKKLPKIKIIVVLTSILLLVACSETNKAFIERNKATRDVVNKVTTLKHKQNTTEPAVVVKPGFYTDTNPITLDDNPLWLQNKIKIRGQNLSLSFFVNHILRHTNTTVRYQMGVNFNKHLNLDYQGDIRGALDKLAAVSNYAYTVDNNKLNWSAFVTKTFDISFMPGNSAYMVGQGSSKTQKKSSDISAISGNLHDAQYSSLQANLSLWADLKETLAKLKSPVGTVNVSEATTSVTVHDTPANVMAIARYIKNLNKRLSRQVLLNIKVLQINLNRNHQFGINWNLAHKIADGILKDWNISSGDLGKTISIASATSATGSTAIPSLTIGNQGGSNAILQALSQQGKLSIVTEPTTTTLNNQVAEIRITRDTSYLKKVEQSVTRNDNAPATIATTLEPGIVTDGFVLYILPKIQNNRVYLQVSSTISTLESINTVSSRPTSTGTSDSDLTQIQIPTLQEKRFNLRSLVNNQGTLIIGGFKQLNNETRLSKMFGSSALGGRAAAKLNTQTIILITPTIIENKS